MNKSDMNVALSFYLAMSEDKDKAGIVMQCARYVDRHYIKRYIIQTLGEPSSIVGDSIYYGGIPITVSSPHTDIGYNPLGVCGHNTFYISMDDGEDTTDLYVYRHISNGESEVCIAKEWMYTGLSVSDMYTSLIREGKKGSCALSLMEGQDILIAFFDGRVRNINNRRHNNG